MGNRVYILMLLGFVVAKLCLADTCPEKFGGLLAPENRIELKVLQDLHADLFKEQEAASPELVKVWNETLLRELDAMPLVVRNPKRINGLTEVQLTELFEKVKHHPVADNDFYSKYDPDNVGIGFCFGRAITAHLEALLMGVAKEDIKKLWIVGHMQEDKVAWAHHVTTMVRGADKKWYAIDPNYSAPMPIAEWYKLLQMRYPKEKLQLFATNAKRWSPGGGVNADAIAPATIHDPFYHHFFEDLMQASRDEANSVIEQRRELHSVCSGNSCTVPIQP